MSISTIVVGVDGSENSARAVAFTAELAAATGARVVAVHAFEPLALLGRVPPPVDFEALERDARDKLAGEWTAPVHAAGAALTCELAEGRPVDVIIERARHLDADVIVVGARGHSVLKQLVLGSTSMSLPHEAGRPVTIVP